jgi:hypothetical protein
MPGILEKIVIRFPSANHGLTDSLEWLLSLFGRRDNHVLELTRSNESYYPIISLDFLADNPTCCVDFIVSTGDVMTVKIENTTGAVRRSPHSYQHIDIASVKQRLEISKIHLTGIDHVGFNLPWFLPGLHPTIIQLREQLSSVCLYHTFPTGEAWDFILPGDEAEIGSTKAVDYTQVRRPKFEIVSFEKASTPLIQIDLSVDAKYEYFSRLFPEALNDSDMRNIWIYLETPYAVDICLVLNETSQNDWSDYFKGFRLN